MEEGEIKGMLRDILQLGWRRFGEPSANTAAALRGVADPERLARLVEAVLDASSWDELLATP